MDSVDDPNEQFHINSVVVKNSKNHKLSKHK